MPYSTRTMTKDDWKEIKHFADSELNYPESAGYEGMLWLDSVRVRAGVPMHLASDHRPPARNLAARGAEKSAHMDIPCDAWDIKKTPTPDDPNWNRARYKIVKAAMDLGCQRIGIYPNGNLHIDRAEQDHPSPRLWVSVDNPAK